jgi:alpha-mannosidase
MTNFRTYLPQVSTRVVSVQDSSGKEIESQLLPLSNITMSVRKKYVKAYIGTAPAEELKYLLAFSVSVPPIGFSTYIVSKPKQTGQCYYLLF